VYTLHFGQPIIINFFVHLHLGYCFLSHI